MKMREILLEARVRFSKDQLDQALADSEFHIIDLTMLPDGDVVLGDLIDRDNPAAHPRRSLRIQVVGQPDKQRELSIRNGSHGEHLIPRAQQAIRALRDAGIIDSTWKIETRRGYGYYPAAGWSYVKEPEPVDTKGLDALADKAIRLSPVAKDLVFYHGTSEMDWQRIQKVGLHPLFVGANQQRGAESRGKHEGNEGVLYLASTVDKAITYAKLRAKSHNHRLHGNEYVRTAANDPVVLRVQIPDPARLVTDDDLIIRLAQRISRRLWQSKTPEDRQRITDQINRERGFKLDPSTAELLWRESNQGFSEIMQRFPKRAFRLWLDSLKQNDQVGYKGIIPPKFISLLLTTTQS